MNEKEALEILKNGCPTVIGSSRTIFEDAYNSALKALEDIQQYRKIGTVEECRKAVNRMKPKRPVKKYNKDRCPECSSVVYNYRSKLGDGLSFCSNCGAVIDWRSSMDN